MSSTNTPGPKKPRRRSELNSKLRGRLRMVNYFVYLIGALASLSASIYCGVNENWYAVLFAGIAVWLFKMMHVCTLPDIKDPPSSGFLDLFKNKPEPSNHP